MSFEGDDNILQDFLVEAGEILEKLGEQLVDLEQRPRDQDLLNAVFRGFHTIKGGAGFLNLTPLVEVCHRAEDVFNLLRQGSLVADPALMDVMLQVLDIVTTMFQALYTRYPLPSADAALLRKLEQLANPAAARAVSESGVPADPVPEPESPSGVDDMTDQEFEELLNAVARPAVAAPVPPSAPTTGSDEISDEEFEALLDSLHGPRGVVGSRSVPPPAGSSSAAPAPAPKSAPTPEAQAAAKSVPEAANSPASTTMPAIKTVTGEIVDPPAGAGSGAAPDTKATAEAADTTVRVDTKRLDDIMNMVGELVLVRNRLVTLESALKDEEMSKTVANMDLVTANLQLAVMKTRMQPIKKVYGRFPRVVRDLSRNLGKEVVLELRGEDTDLDKNLVDALADPLVHLVRNAVDHGIEMPDVRESAGKPRHGTIVLSAEQEGDHIRLSIADDGAGMDPELLRRKAVEKGVLTQDAADRLDREGCFNLIFLPGFSTKTEISDVSGRGVGMDVVKTRIGQLNGVVEIDSEPGKGTRLNIKVPLTLAIMPTLMVIVGDQRFALPLTGVNEIFDLDPRQVRIIDGQAVVLVRDRPVPLFWLREWLVAPDSDSKRPKLEHVVMVHVGTQRVGLVVEQLIGQEEVVVKPLGALLLGTAGLSGATITGDGRLALILDVAGLLKAYGRPSRGSAREVA